MRFWLTVAVFAVLNLGAWFAYHQWLAPRPDLVQVEDFSPGEGGVLMTWGVHEESPSPAPASGFAPVSGFAVPSANPFGAPIGFPPPSGFSAPSANPFASGSSTSDRLIFRFNLPMETDGDVNRQPPGRITPTLAGVWRWEDPRQLVFVPSAAPLATRFSVTLDPQVVRARGGFRLVRAFTATFQTPALQVTEAGVMQADPDGVYQLRVAFSDVVLADEVRAAVRVVEADGTPVAIQHWSVIGREARLITESLSSRAQARNGPVPIRIVVKAGLTGRSGPLGLAVERTFPLVLDSALRLERVHAAMTVGNSGVNRGGAGGGNDGEDQGQGIIHLEFNRAVQLSTVRQVLSVEPAVSFTPTGDGTSVLSLIGAFRPGQRYAVVIAAPPPGAAGPFPLSERMPAWMPEHAPDAWFPAGSGRLGSQGTRTLALKAVNLRATTLRAWRLYDSNLLAWAARSDVRQPWQVATLGRPLLERRLTIGEEKNRVHDLRVDLERELPADARGDGVVLVEVDEQHSDRLVDPQQSGWSRYGYGYYGRGPSQAVVSLSDLALSCRRGVDGCTVWVTSLSSAQPVADVRVRVFSSKLQLLGTAVSGADGLARISEVALSKAAIAGGETTSVVIADTPTGALSWLALSSADALRDPFADTGGEPDRAAGLSAFIHAERGVWRPGETAHLRAIVRDGAGQVPAVVPLRWRFRRPDAKIWRDEIAQTLPSGDLLLDVPLPTDLPTGAWQAELTLPGDERVLGQVAMQIEDFMPDRLTVTWRHEGAGLMAELPGRLREAFTDAGVVTLRAQADYLFGKPASGRTLKAWARIDPATWHPSGSQWQGWTFSDSADSVSVLDRGSVSGTRSDPPTVVADAQGKGSWDFDLAKLCADQAKGRARPWRLLSGGEVQEVGGRAVSANAPPLLLHQVRTWLGGRLVEGAGTTALELRIVSPSGAPTPGNATVRLHREQWTSVIEREHGITRYRSTRELIPVGDAAVVAVTADSGRWVLPADLPAGTYALCAEWQATRQMISIAHRPGAPGGWQESLSRERPDRCEVTVRRAPTVPVADAPVPDAPAVVDPKAPLIVGGEALVTIRSPFQGRALLTVCTDRVVEARVLELTGNALELRLPVTAAWRPDAFICVAVIRRVEASAQLRLHRAWGVVRARTDESSRHLAVELTTPALHVPGNPMTVTGVVRSADGAVAPGATVTFAVVDEGILRLTAYRSPDPFAWFIRPRALGVTAWDAYADLLPELPRVGGDSPTGGDDGGPRALALGRYQSPVSAKRVVPFAWWSGLLTSDAEGRVGAQVPVPANFNGRLRVMAVVASGAQAGMAEGWSTARGPLVVQTSWPRFVAPGDRFQVSATVMNLSGAPGRLFTRVVLPADGLLRTAVIEQQQALADGAEARVVFEVTAAAQSGVAQTHVIAELSRDGVASPLMVDDAVELPVRPGSPRITLGGEATVTAAAPWRGEVPGNFMPGSGTVELLLASRPGLSLPRGLDYLYRYPHGCAEQTTSGCFPLVHLRDLGDQLAPDLFLPAGITRRLNDGINRLQLMEVDGGLSMWAGGDYWSWTSVYATHFLIEARRAGHAVPEDFLRRMLAGCRRLDARNEWKWAETQAYACYVLALAGQPAHALMQRLEDLLKIPTSEAEIGPGTRCWLSAAWLESGRKDLATALVPQRLPTLRKDRHLDGDLASPVRDRAVLLATLIDVMPDHPGIPGLAQELAGLAPWPSTQDTSFALLALGRYLRHAKQTPPPTAVRLLVDGKAVGTGDAGPSLRWSGTAAKTVEASIEGEPQARSWISWLATGVPLTPPADTTNGLTVERRWFDEHGKDITGKPLTSGDLVRVELTVTSAIAYRGVVLEDLLPAGLEIENPRLLGNAAGRPLPVPNQSQRSEVRDDRLITMGDLVRAEQGKWVLTGGYLARVVTPGTYALPPLRAECMYDIAVNGIAGAGTVVVTPAR